MVQAEAGNLEVRRARVLDAALAVVARRGAADASIREIAKAAGVAMGSLYQYFRDKDDLLNQLGIYFLARRDAVEYKPGAHHNSRDQILDLLGHHTLAYALPDHAGLYALFRVESGRRPALQSFLRAADTRLVWRLTALLAGGMDRGEFRRGTDPGAVARVLVALADGFMVRRAAPEAPGDLSQEVRQAAALVLDGLAAGAPTPRLPGS